MKFGKICNMMFRKWEGGVKGRLELFQKFIRCGGAGLPLVKRLMEGVQPKGWASCCWLLSQWTGGLVGHACRWKDFQANEDFFLKKNTFQGGEPQAVIGFGRCHTDPVYSTGGHCHQNENHWNPPLTLSFFQIWHTQYGLQAKHAVNLWLHPLMVLSGGGTQGDNPCPSF